jgi:hypothetical protein
LILSGTRIAPGGLASLRKKWLTYDWRARPAARFSRADRAHAAVAALQREAPDVQHLGSGENEIDVGLVLATVRVLDTADVELLLVRAPVALNSHDRRVDHEHGVDGAASDLDLVDERVAPRLDRREHVLPEVERRLLVVGHVVQQPPLPRPFLRALVGALAAIHPHRQARARLGDQSDGVEDRGEAGGLVNRHRLAGRSEP